MKLKGIYVLLSMAISIGLVLVSDIPLNAMLGTHPLQSELMVVHDHVQSIQSDQAEGVSQAGGWSEQELKWMEWGVFGLFALCLLAGLLWLGLGLFKKILKKRKGQGDGDELETESEDGHGGGNPAWLELVLGFIPKFVFVCCGVLFLASGVLYVQEGKNGQKQLQSVVDDIILRQKQNRPQTLEGEVRERVFLEVHRRDGDRIQRGYLMGILGTLVLLGGLAVRMLRPPKVSLP